MVKIELTEKEARNLQFTLELRFEQLIEDLYYYGEGDDIALEMARDIELTKEIIGKVRNSINGKVTD